jgi:HK97 family phage portal protein
MFENLFEKRNISFQSLWASGGDLQPANIAGVVLNADTALTINAVFSAVSLYADSVSTLPLDAYYRRDGELLPFRSAGGAPAWVQNPDVDFAGYSAFYSAVIVSLLLEGNAFVRVYSNSAGEVVNLVVLNPNDVEVKRNGLGRLIFTVKSSKETLNSDEMIHVIDILKPGAVRGTSRVEVLKENLSIAKALEGFTANFFGQGTHMAGIIEVPQQLTQEQAEALAAGVDRRHGGWRRSSKTGVLTGGAMWRPTGIDPDKAGLIEQRRFAVLDVARAFAIPPYMLGVTDSGMSYSSVEQQGLQFVAMSLRPLVAKIENTFSRLMARTPGGENAFIRFNMDALVRADLAARTTAYSSALQAGWMSINDVRRVENLRRVDDESADKPRVPLASVNIDSASLSGDKERVQMAQMLVAVGYSPESVSKYLGLDISHTGLPSSQLQQIAQIDPENPSSAYPIGAN